MAFYSEEAMTGLIDEIRACLDDEKLTSMFERCFRNTPDTTAKIMPDGTTYVVTGDIPAMWLRDSAAQFRPYLILAARDRQISDLIAGVVKRQCFYINIDPYANAFNETMNGACWHKDETETNGWVWERKYELDSLCYPMQLAYLLWKNTGRTDHLDEGFVQAVHRILDVLQTEQAHEERSMYRFMRSGTTPLDTLSRDGKGTPVRSGTGLVWSGFRPSDDTCTYGYLIPSNMFAVVILGYLEEIAETVLKDSAIQKTAAHLGQQIRRGIEQTGVTENARFGQVYAYETDGFGHYNLMDDANVPSLLSMEYLGYKAENVQCARNTRAFILSNANPYYYSGQCASGIGSPHTPPHYIWHIALAMEGLTADTRAEKLEKIRLMAATDGGTGIMHEGFLADDPGQFTREWFSWANALFCELILDYCGYHIKK